MGELGCFTESIEVNESQNFLSAQIDLKNPLYDKQWICVAISYNRGIEKKHSKWVNIELKKDSKWGELNFYINGEKKATYHNVKLASNIQYIGNSSTYDEPFGVVADIRVYKNFYDEINIKHLFSLDRKKEMDQIVESDSNNIIMYIAKEKNFKDLVSWFLGTSDKTEESIYYCIKLFNNLFNRNRLKKFLLEYNFLIKLNELFATCKKNETKKEICKFLYNLE